MNWFRKKDKRLNSIRSRNFKKEIIIPRGVTRDLEDKLFIFSFGVKYLTTLCITFYFVFFFFLNSVKYDTSQNSFWVVSIQTIFQNVCIKTFQK